MLEGVFVLFCFFIVVCLVVFGVGVGGGEGCFLFCFGFFVLFSPVPVILVRYINDILMVSLPNASCNVVNVGTGWLCVCLFWLDEIAGLVCSFYISVAVSTFLSASVSGKDCASCWDVKQPWKRERGGRGGGGACREQTSVHNAEPWLFKCNV